jgi:hypothetical protein
VDRTETEQEFTDIVQTGFYVENHRGEYIEINIETDRKTT